MSNRDNYGNIPTDRTNYGLKAHICTYLYNIQYGKAFWTYAPSAIVGGLVGYQYPAFSIEFIVIIVVWCTFITYRDKKLNEYSANKL